MPNLVAVDVSVADDRLRLAFSDRAVAAAYGTYLRAQDRRSTGPGTYRRAPRLHTATKEVSLALPEFITWFITCRLPDDEDSVTFTFMPEHGEPAARWAESMVLFEELLRPPSSSSSSSSSSSAGGGCEAEGAGEGEGDVKQLHVRRLWNRAQLLKRLSELTGRGGAGVAASPLSPLPPLPTTSTSTSTVMTRRRASSSSRATPTFHRSRVGSPMWGNGVGAAGEGGGGGGAARAPVAVGYPVPAGMQRGDIWW